MKKRQHDIIDVDNEESSEDVILILDEDKENTNKLPMVCNICLVCLQNEECVGDYNFVTRSCSHTVCTVCLGKHIQDEIHSNLTATWDSVCCPKCDALMAPRDVKRYLTPQLEKLVNRRYLQRSSFELLFALLKVTAASSSWSDILDPFPLSGCESMGSVEKLGRLSAVIQSLRDRALLTLPQPRSLLDKKLNELHVDAKELMLFLLGSSESYSLTRIPITGIVKCMGTPHQYSIELHPRNNNFTELREKYGSRLAFHGSHPQNWFAIIHGGLRNLSGTSLMKNGQAYGSGIYLSPSFMVSAAYSDLFVANAMGGSHMYDRDEIYDDELCVESLRCIALCEVIDHDLSRYSGDVWVQPHEDHVAVRILFVYEKHDPRPSIICNMSLLDATVIEDVKSSLEGSVSFMSDIMKHFHGDPTPNATQSTTTQATRRNTPSTAQNLGYQYTYAQLRSNTSSYRASRNHRPPRPPPPPPPVHQHRHRASNRTRGNLPHQRPSNPQSYVAHPRSPAYHDPKRRKY